MLGRRFLILVAVLMGLTALAASVAPRQPVTREARETPTPTPAATGSPTFSTVHKTVSTEEDDARVAVRVGDVVQLEVAGDERDSVMVLGRIDTIDPTTPARFSLLADEPGEHPIELLEAGERIGTLVVR
jgi:hypothetical protein